MRRFALWLLFVWLLPAIAMAQSSPGFTLLQVPSLTDWNAYFSGKADVTSGTLTNPTINGTVSGSANIGSGAAIATGSTTSRSLAARFGQVINVKDYGAVGDGAADDSGAFLAAINQSNAYSAAGTPACVLIPGGQYKISTSTLPVMTRGGCIRGDATHKTYVLMATAYSGDLFAWSESWMSTNYNGTTLAPASDLAGPILQDLTIIGDSSAVNTQNAIVFYDRNDFVNIQNVDVFFVHGACLKIGTTLTKPQAYMRESAISDLNCFSTGLASVPAVTVSSTTASGSDATNEVKFNRLQIFNSPGVGLSITNPVNFSATRLLEFFAPRVEQSGGDNIQVGSSTDAGQVHDVRFYGLESISPGGSNSGFFGLNLDTAGVQMYGITVDGASIGPCGAGTCKGLNVGNARLSQLHFTNITTTGTNVTYTANAGANIVLDGGNNEQFWTYSIATASRVVMPIYRYGDPTQNANGTATYVATNLHDNSSTFGNSVGNGGVDLQIVRNSAAQVASQPQSCLVAGAFNTIAGNASQGCIAGGNTNALSGAKGFIGGGLQATDRGRDYTQEFAAGQFSATGDAQSAHFVLSATCASCVSQQLAAVHAAASATNIANISNNQSYAMSWRCVARDTTSAGTDNATFMPILLMTRDANAASTAVSAGTAATVTRGTWTGGGFAFTADTTNGGLKIAFTSPTGNTDTFHTVCEGLDAETQ